MLSPRRSGSPTGGCAAPGRRTKRARRGRGSLRYRWNRKLGSGFGTYLRHSQEASAGIVALEETGISAVIALDLCRVLGYPAREQLHRSALGGDGRRVRPGRRGRRADEGLDLFLDCFCRPLASPSLRSRRRNSSRPLRPPASGFTAQSYLFR